MINGHRRRGVRSLSIGFVIRAGCGACERLAAGFPAGFARWRIAWPGPGLRTSSIETATLAAKLRETNKTANKITTRYGRRSN